MNESKDRDFNEFSNPLAVIQAAIDLLSRDPDNKEKINLVCRIINQQATLMSKEIAEKLEEEFALEA